MSVRLWEALLAGSMSNEGGAEPTSVRQTLCVRFRHVHADNCLEDCGRVTPGRLPGDPSP
jgi:hypothetical protein